MWLSSCTCKWVGNLKFISTQKATCRCLQQLYSWSSLVGKSSVFLLPYLWPFCPSPSYGMGCWEDLYAYCHKGGDETGCYSLFCSYTLSLLHLIIHCFRMVKFSSRMLLKILGWKYLPFCVMNTCIFFLWVAS